MLLARRKIIKLMAGSALASLLPTALLVNGAQDRKIKAVAFDAFPVFDPRPIFALVEEMFPGKGKALSHAWR
ncbi:hypothetical protein MNBD_GAMMA08-2055, partial [hydrothermal vent metagenome]